MSAYEVLFKFAKSGKGNTIYITHNNTQGKKFSDIRIKSKDITVGEVLVNDMNAFRDEVKAFKSQNDKRFY